MHRRRTVRSRPFPRGIMHAHNVKRRSKTPSTVSSYAVPRSLNNTCKKNRITRTNVRKSKNMPCTRSELTKRGSSAHRNAPEGPPPFSESFSLYMRASSSVSTLRRPRSSLAAAGECAQSSSEYPGGLDSRSWLPRLGIGSSVELSPFTSPSLSSSVAFACSRLLLRLPRLVGRAEPDALDSARLRPKTFWNENCRFAVCGGGRGGCSESPDDSRPSRCGWGVEAKWICVLPWGL
jgi:hypothetical protein